MKTLNPSSKQYDISKWKKKRIIGEEHITGDLPLPSFMLATGLDPWDLPLVLMLRHFDLHSLIWSDDH